MHSEPIGTTTASLVAELPADRSRPWPVWISFATPCTGLFLPVYLDAVIPAELARGGAEPRPDSAWWQMKRLHDAAAADFPRHTPRLREGWGKLEERIEAERAEVEDAAAHADRDTAAALLSGFMARTVLAALEEAETLAASAGRERRC